MSINLPTGNLGKEGKGSQQSNQNDRRMNQQLEMSVLDLSMIQKKASLFQDMSFKTNLIQMGSPVAKPPKSPPKQSKHHSLATKSINEIPKLNHKVSIQTQNILQKQFEQSSKDSGQKPTIQMTINWPSVCNFLKLTLFSYEFNLVSYLTAIDQDLTDKVLGIAKIAPGYKPIQYIYLFYTLKYGIVTGTLAALIYPLPYSILYLFITVDFQVPFVAIFMLAGMRSGAVALLLKYCLHFPKYIFHWIVLLFTITIGVILQNNYIYFLLFAISIFLSFYIHQGQGRNSNSSPASDRPPETQRQNQTRNTFRAITLNFNEQQIYKEYKVMDDLPETYPNASIGVICGSFLVLWGLQRYLQNRELNILEQFFPFSFLTSSKEMLAFFPFIYKNSIKTSTLSANTLISLSFLFPGPHSKAFMFFITSDQLKQGIIGYLCLYLPSILSTNIFIGYRPYFFTTVYYNIRQSIQAVGNGMVFCLVFWMLQNQGCFFNSMCYSAVVIMVVAKLYKLRELFAITLGIFLISCRTLILNINKNIPFQVQGCINENYHP